MARISEDAWLEFTKSKANNVFLLLWELLEVIRFLVSYED